MNKHTDKIIETIYKFLPKTEEEWELVGFINKKNEIFTFGNDSKIIGRLFEVISYPALKKAANELGYKLYESEQQTVYPDFFFEKENGKKIAIDVKTTYRKSKKSKYGFTGGSFTSFMRNGTKNIVGNYSDYDAHYILGFVYTRESLPTTGKVNIKDIANIIPAYKNVEFFIQEKFRICGDKKGSGNTDNIGTIKYNSIEPFEFGAGPFSLLGEDVFHHYWTNHPKYKDSRQIKESLYNDIPSYITWLSANNKNKASQLQKLYEKYLTEFNLKWK